MTDLLQQILDSDDLPLSDPIEVPEWGVSVRVRGLSGLERDAFEASLRDDKGDVDTKNIRAKLVARAMVGDDGERIIPNNQINAFGKKSGAVLDRLFDEIRARSGMTDESEKELSGNSEAAPSDGSTSA